MRFKLYPIVFLSTLLLLPLLAGCGGEKIIDISGSVTYEGQPVPKGKIAFLTQDGKGPTAAAVIVDGKYTAQVASGSSLVWIEGFKVTGQQPLHPGNPSSPMVENLEPMIPEEYNSEKSTLKADIRGNSRVFDFHLKKSAGGS